MPTSRWPRAPTGRECSPTWGARSRSTTSPPPPTPITHLDQLRALLVWLAVFLGMLGVVALAHAIPVAAAAAALVASVPGWRAARMDVADALRSE